MPTRAIKIIRREQERIDRIRRADPEPFFAEAEEAVAELVEAREELLPVLEKYGGRGRQPNRLGE